MQTYHQYSTHQKHREGGVMKNCAYAGVRSLCAVQYKVYFAKSKKQRQIPWCCFVLVLDNHPHFLPGNMQIWHYYSTHEMHGGRGKVGVGGVPGNMHTKINTACAVSKTNILQSPISKDKYHVVVLNLIFIRVFIWLEICKCGITILYIQSTEAREKVGVGGVPGNMHTKINTACAVIVSSVLCFAKSTKQIQIPRRRLSTPLWRRPLLRLEPHPQLPGNMQI